MRTPIPPGRRLEHSIEPDGSGLAIFSPREAIETARPRGLFNLSDMTENENIPERPASFWRRIYIAVIVTTFVVITLLWAFSRYFS